MRKLAPLAVALLALVAVAGCSTGHPVAASPSAAAPASTPSASPSSAPSVEPRTYEGVKAAVDRLDALDAAHNAGGAWDMLTASGQAAMTRADYVKVLNGCPKLLTSEPTLSIALDAGGASATITSAAPPEQGGGTFTWHMVYEAGHWKHQPSDGAMTWMVLGADKALTLLRANGLC